MYSAKIYGVEVNINLEPGLYIFSNESAIGKSRLSRLLKEIHNNLDKNVDSYTFADKNDGRNIDEVFSKECKVALFDRYERYYGDSLDFIEELSKNAIVLIDYKSSNCLSVNTRTCYINMLVDKIEVTL